MVVERHYTREGLPAYVVVWKQREGEPRKLLRLVYPVALEFDDLWGRGVDQLALPLD